MSEKSAPPIPDSTITPDPSSASSPPLYQGYQSGPPNPIYQQQPGTYPQQQQPIPPQYQQSPPIQPQYQQGPSYAYAATAQPVYGTASAVPVVLISGYQGNAYPHFPVQTTCPFCQTTMVTSIQKSPGLCAWVSCGVLAFMGCIFGCCLLPF